MPEGPPPRLSGRPGQRSRPRSRARARPHRWRRRRVLGLAAPALAAAVAAVVLGITLTGNGSDQAWAAALVRVAEAAPRLLVDEDGWEITRADQFSVDYGEMTLAKDGQELEIKWMPGSSMRRPSGSAMRSWTTLERRQPRTARRACFATGGRATTWRSGCAATTSSRRGLASDTDAFRAVLASLHEVDVDTWLSAMPESVVKPTSQADVIENMLAGIPLPPGLDRRSIPTTDAVRDRYQLGAQVTGTVACAWIDRWVGARRVGDEAAAREAVDAMSTSRTWPVLQER